MADPLAPPPKQVRSSCWSEGKECRGSLALGTTEPESTGSNNQYRPSQAAEDGPSDTRDHHWGRSLRAKAFDGR